MTTIVNDRPLTRDERDLLAAVSRHLRADGWTLTPGRARHPSGIAACWQYDWHVDGKTGRSLQVRILNRHGYTARVPLEVDADSVREAVDVAVAVGLLPQGMSSAYQAGRESASRWTEPLPVHAEDIRPGWLFYGSGLVLAVDECDLPANLCPWHGNCVVFTTADCGRVHYRATSRFRVSIPVAAS